MKRIRSRLVAAFLIVVLLPAIPLSVVVWRLLDISFDARQGAAIGEGLRAGMEESRKALREAKAEFERDVREVLLPRFLEDEEKPHRKFTVIAEDGTMVWRCDMVSSFYPEPQSFVEEDLLSWFRARSREDEDRPSWFGPDRVGTYLAMGKSAYPPDYQEVLFARPLDPGLVSRAGALAGAIRYREAFRVERSAVLRSYALPFVAVYLVLIAAAVGAGALISRRLSAPLESLAGAARRIGDGDLTARVPARSGGEIGELEQSFNAMVGELEAQQKELARLTRLATWREMARSLAHEIKNPLTPIRLAVQEIGDRYPGGDERYAATLKECIEIVNEEVEALRKLVREFSEFARLPEPKVERGDLSALADEMVRLYGDERVRRRGAAGERIALFDHDQIRRAAINLVDNGLAACRMAGRPERVTVAVEPAGAGAAIVVSDEGCGIPARDLERIFEPHFSTRSDGMGLGLAIVEGIVRSHDGSIDVRSVSGEGTTFTITLPGAEPDREES